MMIAWACGAGSQTRPLQDLSVARKPLTPLSATDPVVRDGLFKIDVVVADPAGNPVSDLSPWDFTLLDNGQPAKIRTLHTSREASEPVPELIFVLDEVNLSSLLLTQTENAITHFLRRNSGRLEAKCFLYQVTREGLFSSSTPTQDGNLLAKEVEQHKFPRLVWASRPIDQPNLLRSCEGRVRSNPLSLRALGSIAIDQREMAGRKVVVWIGPGWPVLDICDSDFDEFTEFSTRLREARITLDNLIVSPNSEASALAHQNFPGPPLSKKAMQPAKMALQVIATHTGGLVLDSPGDLDGAIARLVDAERSFYTLTFNPPQTDRMDEFHRLGLQVDRPGLTARAATGYYNEPVYFDSSRPGIEKVTVAQLAELVHAQKDLHRRLTNLELTERLSTPRLDALLSEIHSERDRQALTADADLSIALAPPADETLNRPPPSIEEQSAILGRAFDYLRNAIPQLPDFYALRNTVRFEEPAKRDNDLWKTPHQDRTLHFAAEEHARVLYRDGHEVVEKRKKLGAHPLTRARARDLETRGTFGAILAYVLMAAHSNPGSLAWTRWERGKDGDLAVFSFRIASTNGVPELSYCCLPQGDGTTLYRNKADTYGEFVVNPETGAIMRIVMNADLDEEREPDVPLIRSQIMVEYAPVELGGKIYICPQRSVNISRGRSERELQEWGMVFSLYSYFETMINDVSFGGYHKFGSDVRILPGFEDTEQTGTPAGPAKIH